MANIRSDLPVQCPFKASVSVSTTHSEEKILRCPVAASSSTMPSLSGKVAIFPYQVFQDPKAIFRGRNFSNVPHVYASTPLGHFTFDASLAKKAAEAAKTTVNGISTLNVGFVQITYVSQEAARKLFVQEAKMGVLDQAGARHLAKLFDNNNVMSTFLAFHPPDTLYQEQRAFLKSRFDAGAVERGPELIAPLMQFLSEQINTTHNLKDFMTALVLRTSSTLFDLTEWPLDGLLPKYADTIARIALYGISQLGDKSFEEELYQMFMTIFKGNFKHIQTADPKKNIIRMIFETRGIDFPKDLKQFEALPKSVRHTVAMNFISLFAAKTHSEITTADWLWANILHDSEIQQKISEAMKDVSLEDLKDPKIFDKSNKLGILSELIAHNVFMYPPFGAQSFMVKKPYTVKLVDGTVLNFPKNSFIVVDYVKCNRSNPDLKTAEQFAAALHDKNTFAHFVHGQKTASFGGSLFTEDNKRTRTCPAALSALYAKAYTVAAAFYFLKREGVKLKSENISLRENTLDFPIISREKRGTITFERQLLRARL